MDLEYDSDLEDVEEFEISQEGAIRPYLYEPERNSSRNSVVSSESDSDSNDGDSSAGSSTHEDDDIPDVSTW